MADTTCGYCGRLAHMEGASAVHLISMFGSHVLKQAVYKCPNCERLNVASETVERDGRGTGAYGGTGTANEERWNSPTWFPVHKEVREFEDVPNHIAQAASEATLCLSVGAYRAVGSLARAVVEATAKDKGAKGKDLKERIDVLEAARHIRPHTAEQAHEVRYFGNGMAHGDFTTPVSKAEAEEIVELMAEILNEVYQSPEKLKKLKAARLAKKAGTEPA